MEKILIEDINGKPHLIPKRDMEQFVYINYTDYLWYHKHLTDKQIKINKGIDGHVRYSISMIRI